MPQTSEAHSPPETVGYLMILLLLEDPEDLILVASESFSMTLRLKLYEHKANTINLFSMGNNS